MSRFSPDIVLQNKNTLVTRRESEYRNYDSEIYNSAILKETSGSPRLQNLRAACHDLPPHLKMKFNLVVKKSGEIIVQGQGKLLPSVFTNEIEHMAGLHAHMSRGYGKLLVAQIQKLSEPMHTHDYDVTVKAIGGTGPAIENEDRIIIAAEGDTAFIPKKLRHASTDTHNFGRKVIAIYIDPEPAGMKPW